VAPALTDRIQLAHQRMGGIDFVVAVSADQQKVTRIHAKGYTDNVVDLMVGKLNRLIADSLHCKPARVAALAE
jgi:hypothetical protein